MRKTHYAALAAIIKRQGETARKSAANARATDQHEGAAYNDGKADALRLLACCFARECGLDYAQFMKACGIQ